MVFSVMRFIVTLDAFRYETFMSLAARPTPDVFTPSQLNAAAKDLLEGAFGTIWVEAEISSFMRASSGHLYFSLKDERAQIKCAMFKFKASSLRFAPANGVKVRARGKVSLYEPRGDYQMIIEAMEEAGEGDLQRAFELLKASLEKEGLFATDRKVSLPKMPSRIAVITSPSGAAIRDVLSVLRRRFPLTAVDVIPVLVQGAGSVEQIVQALKDVDASSRYDVVLLTRGGGSLEDLWSFNEEPVVRAVAAMNTPIVGAIGHETDFSLAEFAADLRAPTPSAAAELLVPERHDLIRQISAIRSRMNAQFRHDWQVRAQGLDRLSLRLNAQHPQAQLKQMDANFTALKARMERVMEHQMSAREMQLSGLGVGRMERVLASQIERKQLRLTGLARTLASVNPLQVLERGFAVVRDEHKHVVTSALQVSVGDAVQVQLKQGNFEAVVDRVEREQS